MKKAVRKVPPVVIERLTKDVGRKVHILHGAVNAKRLRGEFAFVVIP